MALTSISRTNPDFGNVPRVAGYGCWEEITDCTGDSDLLTIDAVDWSRSTDGSIVVRTTPACRVAITSCLLDNNSNVILGTGDKRGDSGFIEKRVGGEWVWVGELYANFPANVGIMYGEASPYCYLDSKSKYTISRELRIRLPEYEPGTTYRLTYFFQAFNEEHKRCSVTHTVSIPKQTNKRFDFVSLGWNALGGETVKPEIRINDGNVPFLLLKESMLECKQGNRWIEALYDKEPAFRIYKDKVVQELMPCANLANHYCVYPQHWDIYVEDGVADYRLTLVFCDNADGSGERYTLTLYLNTELLAEYQ